MVFSMAPTPPQASLPHHHGGGSTPRLVARINGLGKKRWSRRRLVGVRAELQRGKGGGEAAATAVACLAVVGLSSTAWGGCRVARAEEVGLVEGAIREELAQRIRKMSDEELVSLLMKTQSQKKTPGGEEMEAENGATRGATLTSEQPPLSSLSSPSPSTTPSPSPPPLPPTSSSSASPSSELSENEVDQTTTTQEEEGMLEEPAPGEGTSATKQIESSTYDDSSGAQRAELDDEDDKEDEIEEDSGYTLAEVLGFPRGTNLSKVDPPAPESTSTEELKLPGLLVDFFGRINNAFDKLMLKLNALYIFVTAEEKLIVIGEAFAAFALGIPLILSLFKRLKKAVATLSGGGGEASPPREGNKERVQGEERTMREDYYSGGNAEAGGGVLWTRQESVPPTQRRPRRSVPSEQVPPMEQSREQEPSGKMGPQRIMPPLERMPPPPPPPGQIVSDSRRNLPPRRRRQPPNMDQDVRVSSPNRSRIPSSADGVTPSRRKVLEDNVEDLL